MNDKALATRAVADCDHLDAGLRDEDPETIEEVRTMIVEIVTVSSPWQLRGFLTVVSSLASAAARGKT